MQTLAAQSRVGLGRTGQGRVHWAWVVQYTYVGQMQNTHKKCFMCIYIPMHSGQKFEVGSLLFVMIQATGLF